MLFLKLPFAVKPGLTDSDFAKMQSNIGLIFRCQGVKVSQGGWSGGNSQIGKGLWWPSLLNGTKCSS